MFVWVPLFGKRVTASIGPYIRGVLVNDGYLCSRVYGIYFTGLGPQGPSRRTLWIGNFCYLEASTYKVWFTVLSLCA